MSAAWIESSTASDPLPARPSDMRVVAVVQARTGSTRLPGKVLADIGGRPMIDHVLERARLIEGVDEVVLAIPDLPDDDELAGLAGTLDVAVVRGPADDVLARYLVALETVAPDGDVVVRLTGDCPLLSPAVSGTVLTGLADADYASNTLDRTFPRGLDTEVIRADALRAAHRLASTAAEREHVTPFIWRRPDRFRLVSVRDSEDHSDLRWTVDVAEDLEAVRAIYAELGQASMDHRAVLDLLRRNPNLGRINAEVTQKPVDGA